MLNYIVTTTQDETEPKATQHLIQDLIRAFPDETARKSVMTFAEQFKEDLRQEFMATFGQQLEQKGLQQGGYNKAIAIAKKMLAKRADRLFICEVTGLSDQDLLSLEIE
jgi:hypothetical protein